jgi:hypothetical protein
MWSSHTAYVRVHSCRRGDDVGHRGADVSLTLSPMMCGYLLKPHPQGAARGWQDRVAACASGGHRP